MGIRSPSNPKVRLAFGTAEPAGLSPAVPGATRFIAGGFYFAQKLKKGLSMVRMIERALSSAAERPPYTR